MESVSHVVNVKLLTGTGYVSLSNDQHKVADSMSGSLSIVVLFDVSNPLTNVCLNAYLSGLLNSLDHARSRGPFLLVDLEIEI